MCARLPVVYVKDDDGDHDAQPDQYHREQQVLAEQGQGERGRRDDFRYQQKEHGLR